MDDDDLYSGGTCSPPPSAPPEEALAVAMRCHQEGRLVEAATQYRRILAVDGTNVAALHLLGVAHNQLGDPERATELIGQAARLKPDAAIIQANLAEACLVAGRHHKAAECARTALERGPDHPVPRCVLGLAMQA